MYVEREFYIKSMTTSGRYLDLIGNSVVVKTPNGFNTQRWWFDQNTKTIKSASDTSKSLELQGSNLRIWKTNGGWF
jgi:hypothetical protein